MTRFVLGKVLCVKRIEGEQDGSKESMWEAITLSREYNENLNQDICSGIEKQRMDTKFY